MIHGILYILAFKVNIMSCIKDSTNFDNPNKLFFINPVNHIKPELKLDYSNLVEDEEVKPLAREEFLILNREDAGLKDLIYFNNATTTHKPNSVLKALFDYYTTNNFSVYRGFQSPHGILSTQMYQDAREKVAKFVNAGSPDEIIFTSGVTDSLNFVVNTWARVNLKKDDVVLLPYSEHNSNLLPWFGLCDELGCKVEYVELHKNGLVNLEHLESLLKKKKAKFLSVGHASNVLGVIQDIKKITKMAHEHGTLVMVDAAQTVGKIEVDVRDMDADFLAGAGHKMYAPTGIGFLYYKKKHLENLNPSKSGGGTVKDVDFETCEFMETPYKFEAGTPPVAQAIGLGATIDFLKRVGMDKIRNHDKRLLNYAYKRMKNLVNLYNFDPKLDRLPIIAFNVDGVDPFDLCSLLASKNIIALAGKHCAYLLHKKYFCTNTIRISMSMYNSSKEVDKFIEALKECIEVLRK